MAVHLRPLVKMILLTIIVEVMQVALIIANGVRRVAFFAFQVSIKSLELCLQGMQMNPLLWFRLLGYYGLFGFNKAHHRFADQVAHLVQIHRAHTGMKAGVFETAYG